MTLAQLSSQLERTVSASSRQAFGGAFATGTAGTGVGTAVDVDVTGGEVAFAAADVGTRLRGLTTFASTGASTGAASGAAIGGGSAGATSSMTRGADG